MIRLILSRLARWIPGMILLMLIVYGLVFFGGGDPIRIMFSAEASESFEPGNPRYEALKERLGLNRPFLVQFGDYLWKMAHGNLGISLVNGSSVNESIAAALPVTVEIALSAVVIIALVGIPLGVIAALNQNRWADNLILSSALFFWGIPTFVAGPLLMVLLCLRWPILPVPHGWDGTFSINAIIPLSVVAIRPMALVIRQARSAVLEVLSEDYIRTARAKGLPEWVIIVKHALRPVLTPVVTQMGLVMSNLLAGSLLLEVVFGIPGIGRLIRDSIVKTDYSVLLGCTVVVLGLVTLTNLLVEISYPLLDPRLRQAQRASE
jgi:ABC-type dipeptide/oligopeptide/nickel transport system permease component